MRPFHHSQYEVWITREASIALNEAAAMYEISRGEYVQRVLWECIKEGAFEKRDHYLPRPVTISRNAYRLENPKPGYKGRWSMWVRARCTVHNSVPFMLTRIATQKEYGSATAYFRDVLAHHLHIDTGKVVTMPKGRSSEHLFGGQINEVVR